MTDQERIIRMGMILEELLNFNGQLEELCIASEEEGQFCMSANAMIGEIYDFISYAKNQNNI